MTVSGWADGYTNAVFRLLEKLDVPRRGMVGPWAHTYPHIGKPGPAIDFLAALTRWWDHWLKGEENGVMDEPMLVAWMQDSEPPISQYREREGRWIAEDSWPSPDIECRTFALRERRLPDIAEAQAPDPESQTIQSPLTTGLFAGKWCSYASGPDLAHDQRQEDGGAMVFETQQLSQPIEIMGAAKLKLKVSVDKPVGMIAARLSDVRPDGSATRFTYGLLNLTHRNSRAHPEPMEPGKPEMVEITLNHIGQRIPAGNRLRLSLSTSYWPLAWPSPEPIFLEVHFADSVLDVPIRPATTVEDEIEDLGEPRMARPFAKTLLEPEQHNWLVHRNLALDSSELEVIDDRGIHRHENTGLMVGTTAEEWYRSVANDFNSVQGETRWVRTLARGEDWRIRTETRTVMSSDAENFYLQADLDAYENDDRVFCRTWSRSVPRDLV
jgi:predicted acyl esterase